MAKFDNPLSRRPPRFQDFRPGSSEGRVNPPRLRDPSVDVAGLVTQAGRVGLQIREDIHTSNLREEVESEAEEFLARGQILEAREDTEQELALARTGRAGGRIGRARVLQQQLDRLKEAEQSGAMSSTEVEIRAKQHLRRAIAEAPDLAGELLRTTQQTLETFRPEMDVLDERLAPTESDLQDQILGNVIDILQNDYGVHIPLQASPQQIMEMAAPYMNLKQRAKIFAETAQNADNVEKMTDHEQADMGYTVASDLFMTPEMHLRGIVERAKTIDDPQQRTDLVAEIRRRREGFRRKLAERLPSLTPTQLDNIADPYLSLYDLAVERVSNGLSLDVLENTVNSKIAIASNSALIERSEVAGIAAANKLGGQLVGDLVASNLGIDTVVRSFIPSLYSRTAPTGEELDTLVGAEAYERWADEVSQQLEEGTALTHEVRPVVRNILKNFLPAGDADISQIEMREFIKVLPVLSDPRFAELVKRSNLSLEAKEAFNTRLQRFLDVKTIPLLKSRLLGETISFRTEAGEGEDPRLRGREEVTTISVLDVTDLSNDGRSVMFNLDKVPEELRNDPDAQVKLDQMRESIRIINNKHMPVWNDLIELSANFSDVDAATLSREVWGRRVQPEGG